MPAPLDDTRSAALYARARAVLPGGVNSPVRAMRAIGRDPLFIERGAGAELFDVDGNRYVDYVCSWGALIAGHAHPRVVEAVAAAAARGTSFGAPTAREVELAEEVARRMAVVEMLRMTSSGTEAAMTALRLARADTGREPILKFAGAYHGHSDGLLAAAGSGLATQGIPASPGVPAAAAAATVVVAVERSRGARRGDRAPRRRRDHRRAATRRTWASCRPPTGSWRCCASAPTRCGALLIFDEVISGFRVARGGGSERSGVAPDLVVLGKIIGGGLPAAAVGGPRELLEPLAPVGEVYQAGTLSGNPLAVAAGLATLALLDDAAYAALARAHAAPRRRACAHARRARPVSVAWLPGLLTVFFAARAAARSRRRAGVRPGGLRRVVPRAARPRRLPAAVAVRGVVPVARPRRRRRSSARSRRRPARSPRSTTDRPHDERARTAQGARRWRRATRSPRRCSERLPDADGPTPATIAAAGPRASAARRRSTSS